ncbi:hypothetical protein AGMMS50212_09750 [Spirochaetia bacterium]|nr:hypothetical protein AGMMS50212_09750 [Spirochaetia bacterium]
MKRICCLCTFIFCILNAYAIPVIAFDEYRDTWNSVSYEKLDKRKQNYYTKLLKYEIEKYPTEYYDAINLQTVVLVKNLKFSGVFRAAVLDNYKKILFIGIRADYSDEYIKHIFHPLLSLPHVI